MSLREGPLPLLLGVVGHRDLRPEDLPALKERVRGLLLELRGRYPHTPLVLLSPLAEGADRLVASVALKEGARLIAVLPMARAAYEEDFHTPESRAELDDLLHRAWQCRALAPTDDDRKRRYAEAGEYVSRHCQILLALWDGEPSEAVGSTAQTVQSRPPNAPLYHLVTPRLSNPSPERSLTWIRPAVTDDDIHESIDRFNRDAADLGQGTSEVPLVPESDAERLPAPLQVVRACHRAASAVSTHFQRRTRQVLVQLLLLVFLAAAAFEVYCHLRPHDHALLLLYPALLGAAFLRFRWMKRGDYQNRYQDYRALAEGLRVQFFWRLAGLAGCAEDHYLRRQRHELRWIRRAIRVCWSLTETLPSGSEWAPLVRRHWLEDQHAFFTDRARRERELAEILALWGTVASAFGVGLAAIAALILAIPNPIGHAIEGWWHLRPAGHGVLILLISLPPVAAALMFAYVDVRALREHATQYEAMRALFHEAIERLQGVVDHRRFQMIVEELGIEALLENSDWLLRHRERPVRPRLHA